MSSETSTSDDARSARDSFSVHAGVTVAPDDRAGRERLCRYGARPPFSLERMSVLAAGQIVEDVRRSSQCLELRMVLANRADAMREVPKNEIERVYPSERPDDRGGAA